MIALALGWWGLIGGCVWTFAVLVALALGAAANRGDDVEHRAALRRRREWRERRASDDRERVA